MMNGAMFEALKWIGIITAFAAAVLWFWSASVRFPKDLSDMTWAGDTPLFFAALRKQARLSAAAAVCAGISVLFQAIAL
jgi:hypothetical protein